MDGTHGISVAFLSPLAELLGRLDEDPAAFLVALGVDDAMAPETYVDADRVDRELEAVALLRGDPAFALTLARMTITRPLGMFGHLVWLSGTVRDALTRAAKFYSMVSGRTVLSLEERDGVAIVRQTSAATGIRRGRILTELPFASLALRGREATEGKLALRAVRFSHAGEATPTYTEVFAAPVSFAAGCDEVELAAAHLDLKLASADPITSAVLEANVARLIAGRRGAPFLGQVRRAAAGLARRPSLAAIATELAVSARTLRRRLENEHFTLREVVDDVRRERADQLLETGTSVKEIAFALGFSEPSAFSRAYKRWTGRSPRR